MTLYVAYVRVSTDKQGQSGLGLEAQEAIIRRFIRSDDRLIEPFMIEVESGKNNSRPVLQAALRECRLKGATLIVAKLDRLARNAAFVHTITSSQVPVTFCDIPQYAGAMGAFLLGIMAHVAQLEAGLTSERTKAALAACKARGVVLGGYRGGPPVDGRLGAAANKRNADAFAARILPIVNGMRSQGASLAAVADTLTAQGIVTPRGGDWTPTAVARILKRAA
jgi:DNA invertase Pin-like site-specific DNA recombinase